MTRTQMLHAEVARRLSSTGHRADADGVAEVIAQAREDAAGLLASLAHSLDACREPAAVCTCRTMAVVYAALAQEVRDDA